MKLGRFVVVFRIRCTCTITKRWRIRWYKVWNFGRDSLKIDWKCNSSIDWDCLNRLNTWGLIRLKLSHTIDFGQSIEANRLDSCHTIVSGQAILELYCVIWYLVNLITFSHIQTDIFLFKQLLTIYESDVIKLLRPLLSLWKIWLLKNPFQKWFVIKNPVKLMTCLFLGFSVRRVFTRRWHEHRFVLKLTK